MAIEGKITSLYTDKTMSEALLPRTNTKAITDDKGVNLNAILDQVAYVDVNNSEAAIAPLNADTLAGQPADNYASKTYVSNEIAKAQLGGDDAEIDLSGYATKDDLAKKLSTSGGKMEGNIDLNSKLLYNVPLPNGWGDAANKGYVDDSLNKKANLLNAGVYTGDLNIVGDGGVPLNSVVWVNPYGETTNTPYGDYGFVETWQTHDLAIIQRYTSLNGITYVRTHYHNGTSNDWHGGWKRIDSLSSAPSHPAIAQYIDNGGWFRVGKIFMYNCFRLSVNTIYDTFPDNGALVDIVATHAQPVMRQISAKSNLGQPMVIDQVRIVANDSSEYYVDIHYNASVSNRVLVWIDGAEGSFEQYKTFTEITDDNLGGNIKGTIALALS